MSNVPNRDQIKKGSQVSIETKNDQGTNNLTDGIVKEILTANHSHSYGIMVRLQDGNVGRVKKMKTNTPSLPSINIFENDAFENLEEKEMPKTEDKYNEFKEFYQYDESMDELPESIPGDKRSSVIKSKKHSVQERFATAVCSFGNDRTGGFVYLGIRSNGIIAGLDKDLRIGEFADYSDSFANHIRDRLVDLLNDKVFVTSKVRIKFREINRKVICIIHVMPSSQPLYVHTKDGVTFYVRGLSPRAEKFEGRDLARYIKERFPDYS